MHRRYHVYIMASLSRVLYIGMTGDLRRRVREHKSGQIPGFTKRYRVKRLVYVEEYASIEEAIRREKQLKAWRREKKLRLIEAANPSWQDLAASWEL